MKKWLFVEFIAQGYNGFKGFYGKIYWGCSLLFSRKRRENGDFFFLFVGLWRNFDIGFFVVVVECDH